MKLHLAIIIAFVLLSSLGFRGCGDKSNGVFTGTWSRKESGKTDRQVSVFSGFKINSALFPEIDKGIDRLKETATLEGYVPLDHPEFIVALFPTSSKCTNPGFLIRDAANTWDNLPPPNDFDKDPRPGHTLLCAAGLHPGDKVLIVADNFGHMATIIEYEGEHATLLFRDGERWEATSGVHAHPIFRQSALMESNATHKAITLELKEDINAEGIALKKGQKFCVLVTR